MTLFRHDNLLIFQADHFINPPLTECSQWANYLSHGAPAQRGAPGMDPDFSFSRILPLPTHKDADEPNIAVGTGPNKKQQLKALAIATCAVALKHHSNTIYTYSSDLHTALQDLVANATEGLGSYATNTETPTSDQESECDNPKHEKAPLPVHAHKRKATTTAHQQPLEPPTKKPHRRLGPPNTQKAHKHHQTCLNKFKQATETTDDNMNKLAGQYGHFLTDKARHVKSMDDLRNIMPTDHKAITQSWNTIERRAFHGRTPSNTRRGIGADDDDTWRNKTEPILFHKASFAGVEQEGASRGSGARPDGVGAPSPAGARAAGARASPTPRGLRQYHGPRPILRCHPKDLIRIKFKKPT